MQISLVLKAIPNAQNSRSALQLKIHLNSLSVKTSRALLDQKIVPLESLAHIQICYYAQINRVSLRRFNVNNHQNVMKVLLDAQISLVKNPLSTVIETRLAQ